MSDRVAPSLAARGPVGALRTAWPRVAAVGIAVPLLVVAEILASSADAVPAAALDGVALVFLLGVYVWGPGDARVFAALALVPLLRLSSLALAIEDPLGFYVLTGVPVLIAVVLAADVLDLPGVLRLWEIRRASQWHVAVAALFAAGVATPLLDLPPLIADRSLPKLVAAALVVFVFVGVLEELLFRGVVQGAMTAMLGGASVVLADLLFAATYVGSGSVPYTVLMATFGLACGFWVRHTGSVAGAAVGHGLFAAGLLVIWPVIL
jgi:membrane protease YdiL (CAAX protease family)